MEYSRSFLQEVSKFRVKHYFAAIMVLDFASERPITRLEGRVVNGSMSLSAKSNTRRTGSMQIVFDKNTFDLTNMDNLIAINKKIALSIGVSNPFKDQDLGREHGDVLWFKQGTFIITSANLSTSVSSRTINIQFIDKMGMLNGVCGGTIPASVSLHDRIEIDPNGNVTTTYPRIKQIVREVVHHFGDEHPSKIIISDIPDFGRQVVTWAGSEPAWFSQENGNFVVGQMRSGFPLLRIVGDDIGYMSTELTYPGELIMKAGTTVTGILDEIVKTLGNFEYFYDVDGFFHFQKIQNFEITGAAPMTGNPKSITPFNISGNSLRDSEYQSQYLPIFQGDQFLNEFSNSELVSQASLNPNYGNIRNDFVVWGSRKTNKDDELMVRYHLAIDERPKDDPNPISSNKTTLCQRWFWAIRNAFSKELKRYIYVNHNGIPSLTESGFWTSGQYNFRNSWNSLTQYFRSGITDAVSYNGYYYSVKHLSTTTPTPIGESPSGTQDSNNYWTYINPDEEEMILHSPALRDITHFPNLSAVPQFDWREELYRKALVGWGTSTRGSYYDEELMAEWRKVFNPNTEQFLPGHTTDEPRLNPYYSTFSKDWREHFSESRSTSTWTGYNVDVVRKPQNIHYWLDLIDSNSGLGAYSVNRIGRRSVVKENNKINEVLNREVPDIVFINGTLPQAEIDTAEDEFISIGQRYSIVRPDYLPYFSLRNSFGTCFEEVRDLMLRHLIYNAQASLTSVPILYLDVSKVVRLNFPDLGMVGNFVINTISLNFGNMSTMQLQLSEAIVIV